MRTRLERGRRLVETDVPVGADAEDLDVDPAGLSDGLFVALALRLRIRRRTIEEVDLSGRQLDTVEEMVGHEPAIAPRVRVADPEKLVEVEGREPRQVEFLALGQCGELAIERHRCLAGRKS